MSDDQQASPDLPPRVSFVKRAVRVVVVIAGVWLVASLVLPFFSNARDAARRNACAVRARLLGVALVNYHEHYHCFPPAYIADRDGKPQHSWRVLLLPFMCELPFYNEYNFDEPWDGPNNRELAAHDNTLSYRCPAADKDSRETNFVAVVGPETMWPGAATASFGDAANDPAKTIVLVEVANSGIAWTEPRDMTLDEALQGINSGAKSVNISSKHADGANVVWGDGHVSFLPNDFPKDQLRAALTGNDRAAVNPSQP